MLYCVMKKLMTQVISDCLLSQVGTLDLLVGLSEDLGKLDAFVEQVMKKVSNYLGDVLEDQRDKLSENLLANGGQFYLTRPPKEW